MCVLCDHLNFVASNCFSGAVTDGGIADASDTPYEAEGSDGGVTVALTAHTVSLEGLFIGTSWTKPALSYGFGGSVADYPGGYSPYGELDSFSTIAEDGRDIFRSAFAMWDGAIGLAMVEAPVGSGQDTPDIMIGGTTATNTAWAYGPGTTSAAGDIWANTSASYNALYRQNDGNFVGSYAYAIALHEIGHSLGLKHPHQGTIQMPYLLDEAYDSLEYTIMSYRSFTGDPSPGAWNVTEGHYPQSPMMLDIQALQTLYGADYQTRSGNTVYAFTPESGTMLVDGVAQAPTAKNVVFRTLWDGGGTDLIELSAYTTDLYVDLQPGAGIDLAVGGTAQKAKLGSVDGSTVHAGTNIYMSLLADGDTRSLIEQAIGGSGDDTFIGNDAANLFTGGAGFDTFVLGAGADIVSDTLAGLDGDTVIDFDPLVDTIVLTDADPADAVASYDAGSGLLQVSSGSGAATIQLATGLDLDLDLAQIFGNGGRLGTGPTPDPSDGDTEGGGTGGTGGTGDSGGDPVTESSGQLVAGTTSFMTRHASDWQQVEFGTTIENARVVVGPPTYEGSFPGDARVRNVTETGFEIQFDEWDYSHNPKHNAETMSWIAGPEGDWTLATGERIVLGRTETAEIDNWQTVALPDLGETPTVLAQITSANIEEAVTTRLVNVNSTGFGVMMQEEEAGIGHAAPEQVDWLAIEALNDLTIDRTEVTHVNEDFASFTFDPVDGDLAILADMQTFNGTDTATLRFNHLSNGSASVMAHEEQSADEEEVHKHETVHVLTLETGIYDLYAV